MKSKDLQLEKLQTPEAKTVYQILDLIEQQLPTDDPLINDFIRPVLTLSKGVCLEIDKNLETKKKAQNFMQRLRYILYTDREREAL